MTTYSISSAHWTHFIVFFLFSLRLVDGGLKKFNDDSAEKLWLMKTQLELEVGRKHEARNAFQNGVKKCTQCIPLWTTYADFELKEGQVVKHLLK